RTPLRSPRRRLCPSRRSSDRRRRAYHRGMARHGEYKTPGGKLVVADVVVEGGRIVSAEVTGDFFLEPETALASMTAALVGAPAEDRKSTRLNSSHVKSSYAVF